MQSRREGRHLACDDGLVVDWHQQRLNQVLLDTLRGKRWRVLAEQGRLIESSGAMTGGDARAIPSMYYVIFFNDHNQ